ncbi:MAG TPA: cobalamin biosynthesis protein CobW [Pseudomonas xinjiangensis]|uniref:Cobalamin biosynthesis protein CobW n=2 Tax=root TaxID=1 RepID=A0A7V1BTL1_9GAMM|nr:cobalamin biosynthesis protein CobW [Halopseudomonas xinjiangensis]HEC46962.1 cobalamin biosynthesis protein CobW [Halopseudomonas xinjiangensis]
MLLQIPTHLVCGPLGAGKTSVLKHLVASRPANERWAILINEFGQVGIDAALLKGHHDDVRIAEIPGGCLCCVNGLPFQVGLGRLLKRAQPNRLFIEASGLGHPAALMSQLAEPPWRDVLNLQPTIMVLDAQALHEGRPLPASQQEALAVSGQLVLNKSADLSEYDRRLVTTTLPDMPLHWCDYGELPWAQVFQHGNPLPCTADIPKLPEGQPAPGTLWLAKDQWICQQSNHEGWYSIGWKMHPGEVFHQSALQRWLAGGSWQRAKGSIHTDAGWLSFNALETQPLNWQPSAWRSDSRIELLQNRPHNRVALESGLQAARMSD